MKFSHTLSLNANPDWEKHYIDYASLKKVINEIEAKTHGDGLENPQKIFLDKLTKMVKHVREFYDKTLAELEREMSRLQPALEKSASQHDLPAMQAGGTERSPLLKSSLSPKELEDTRAEICDMFTRYHNLDVYRELK